MSRLVTGFPGVVVCADLQHVELRVTKGVIGVIE